MSEDPKLNAQYSEIMAENNVAIDEMIDSMAQVLLGGTDVKLVHQFAAHTLFTMSPVMVVSMLSSMIVSGAVNRAAELEASKGWDNVNGA